MITLSSRAGAIIALLASSALLVSCGGSTVTSDEARTLAPAPAQPSSTSTAESTAPEPAPEPGPQDRGAQEVESVPPMRPQLSEKDTAFIQGLGDIGLDTAGIETVLLTTAAAVCTEGPVSEATPQAIAGQLVEQGRIDKDVEEVTRLLTEHSRTAYCP